MVALTKLNRDTWEYEPVEGTEDFEEVARLDSGEMYSWDSLGVYYSKSRRLFFWLHDSGCSCNSYGEYVESIEDFENGPRAAVINAAEAFAIVRGRDNYYGVTPEERASFLEQIRTFKPGAAQ
ncbi:MULTISPECIES: DUF7574 domain-containing protein [Bacteria]|uniref:DUF7574 domain-containing protein n=1 Tax=Bacteria TaxID=2 RepID=UPI003C7BE7CA